MKKKLFGILRFVISFGAIAVLLYFYRNKIDEVYIILKDTKLGLFSLAFGIFALCLFIISNRLKIIFNVQKVDISLGVAYYLTLIGQFFNVMFPSAVGGDAAKIYYAYKKTDNKMASFTSVLLDRMMGYVSMIFLAACAYLFYGRNLENKNIQNVIIIMVVVSTLSLLLVFSKRFAGIFKFLRLLVPSEKLQGKIAGLHDVLYRYKHHKGILAGIVLISLLSQTFYIILHYVLSLSIDAHIPLKIFFMAVPVICVLSIAPSISGLGVREAAFVYFLSPYTTPEKALALSLAFDAVFYGLSLLCGILYAFCGGLEGAKYQEIENAAKA